MFDILLNIYLKKESMKPFKICGLFILVSFVLGAQPYAHHLYSHAGSNLNTGLRTSINSNGFLMIGSQIPTALKPINFSIDKTDVGGVLSGPNFIQRQYQIIYSPSCNSQTIQPTNAIVTGIETNIPGSPSAWYALAGAFDQSIFFATIDQSGNPIVGVEYPFPFTASSSKPIITESSATANEYYIVGTVGTNTVYALKVDATGTILWSRFFEDSNLGLFETYDVVESPYASEILIIGHVTVNPYGRASDGFILRLDNATGNSLSFNTYGGPGGSCDSFEAIAIANSALGGQGFVPCGSMDPFSSLGQIWVVKLDPLGNYIWSTEVTPSTDPGARITHDIIERQNSSGSYEYYVVFSRNPSGMGVLKFDDAGSPFPGGVNNEFVYDQGSSSPNSISHVNIAGGPDEGIHVYGTDNSGAGDHYLVEAYFSGESVCNETLTTMNSSAGPQTFISPALNQFGTLSSCNSFMLISGIYDDYPVSSVCWNSSIPGGSNARNIPASLNKNSNYSCPFSVSPNPASSHLKITFALSDAASVKVDIYNAV